MDNYWKGTLIRNETKVFDYIERIKQLQWKWSGDIVRRCKTTRDIKLPRKRPQVSKRDEIRKVAGVNWMKKALYI